MLFTLVISYFFILAAANPFHKYPYVFLLDVGNEELQKTKSEQIRVSIPGGSLALRYPATGDTDTIAHVRVSGIDFGTDLKANIIDGGPGYKYVIIVFMGNPGMPYDAVVTIQTVPNEQAANIQDTETNELENNSYEVSEDENKSAEEIDSEESLNDEPKSQVSQASENNYNYVENEVEDNDYSDDAVAVNSDDDDDTNQDQNIENSDQSVEYDGQNNDADEDDEDDDQEEEDNAKEEYSYKNDYVANEYYSNERSAGVIDNLYYARANLMRPYLYNGVRVFPEQVQYMPQGMRSGYVPSNADEDQAFNEDIHDKNSLKYKDSNNNNFDDDENSAVES